MYKPYPGFFPYIVTWTDIYNNQHVDNVEMRKPTENEAVSAIPNKGDIFKKIDKIEEAIWDDRFPYENYNPSGGRATSRKKFIPKPNPYANSKVPVIIGDNNDFVEYGSEFVPNQGEINNFEEAHNIAKSLLKDRPNTVLLVDKSGMWWIGKMDPIKKGAKDKNTQHVYPRSPVFYKNYDLYETEGVDGPAKQGPGAGFYQNMNKYKSVSDFIKKKRKRKGRKRKLALLAIACDCNNLDFPTDQINSILPFDSIMPIGMFDNMTPQPTDEDGHTVNKLYYGTKDDADPVKFNPLGIDDGNEKGVGEEPEETKNPYYGILP